MKFEDSKVLKQLDQVINKEVLESFNDDIANNMWEDCKSVIKDLYEGEDVNVFDKYMNNEETDLNDDCKGALNDNLIWTLQAMKARILSRILLHVYDPEESIEDDRIAKVEETIKVYISKVAEKDLKIMALEKLELAEGQEPSAVVYNDSYGEVFDMMLATHIAFILNNCITYNLATYQLLR